MDEKQGDATTASLFTTEDEDLQLLEALMQANAHKWDTSAIRLLISATTSLGNDELQGNWARCIERMKSNLLFPLAKILAMEKTRIEQERQMFLQKEQEANLKILSLQEERNNVLQQFEEESNMLATQNMFIETLLRDLAEMAQAVNSLKKLTRELQRALVDKELDVEQLLADKQELFRIAITTGPKAFVERVKAELLAQGQEVGKTFEQQWLGWRASSETTFDKEMETISIENGYFDQKLIPFKSEFDNLQKVSFSLKGISSKHSLVQVLLVGIYHETLSSLNHVMKNGLSAIPFALLGFWGNLIGHVTDHVAETILLKVRTSPLGLFFKLL